MEHGEMVKAIQNAVSAFEKSSGRIVQTIEICKHDVTWLKSTEREFQRFISVAVIEMPAPMEPML